ncbi:FixH family protein [Marinobacter daepoensis]|uniref:FixH family protein n=1 Tax=Marinobacter daepoensis TaxID=262077 RepID=A0ABS3BEY8_9GAMM|nr:FixH family protein [Marinobacter daepoensis]MBN7769446.1 FixH family protein [Marinobacter daepoensis]MBY6031893.1 FixH family protein [Marinobacter daepoensis]MBY6078136.1 FixH family protein [Marinobacter daepoensis]
MTDNAPVAPWYRQPWFWFLTIFPLASMMWGVTALVVSSSMDNSLVTDDYSKQGRGINMSIARDEQAAALELAGTLNITGRSATLALDTTAGAADYPYLVFNLYHPTLSGEDKTVQFSRVAPGEYRGQLLEDVSGRWYYDLQGPDNDWRVKGELRLPSSAPIHIEAQGDAQG